MPMVIVTVLCDGDPASGHRVALRVRGVAGAMKHEQNTDQGGIAEFIVEYGQEGEVYVDDSNEGHWGSYSETEITVNL